MPAAPRIWPSHELCPFRRRHAVPLHGHLILPLAAIAPTRSLIQPALNHCQSRTSPGNVLSTSLCRLPWASVHQHICLRNLPAYDLPCNDHNNDATFAFYLLETFPSSHLRFLRRRVCGQIGNRPTVCSLHVTTGCT